MNILIVGGNTANKGAHLMMLAIYEQIKFFLPNSEVLLSPTLDNNSSLLDYGYKKVDFPFFHVGDKKWFNRGLKYPLLTRILFDKFKNRSLRGKFKPSEIDLVLDISGFAYGEKFGETPIKNVGHLIRFFKKLNTPYILMPQAFGPFPSSMDMVARKSFKEARLIVARDFISYDNLQKLNLNIPKLLLSPDITLSIKSTSPLPTDTLKYAEYCCIVPNVRMLDKASESWRKNYKLAINKTTKILLNESKYDIVFLIHSTAHGGDSELTKELYECFERDKRVHMLHHDDPLILKSVLANAKFLVGSRFHALASSLSSGTPAIATSWLHKYEMLFQEYNVEEHSHNEFSESFYSSIRKHLNESYLNLMISKIINSQKVIQNKNHFLWEEIIGMVGK